jgi:hypothetical protein
MKKSVNTKVSFVKYFRQHTALTLVLVVLLPMGAIPAFADLKRGLVGYWTLDIGDIDWKAKTILDRSGNGNIGTLVGMSASAHLRSGKTGQALRFSGTDTAITIPGSQSLNHRITNSYSFSVWLNLTSFPSKWVPLFHKGVYQQLAINKNLIVLRSGAELTQLLKHGSPIKTLAQWYHVASTFDGSNQVLYVDGSPIISNSVTGRAGGISSLRVGGTSALGGRGDNTGFEMLLDEIRVYDRALTSEEVLTLYQATSFDKTPLLVPTVPAGFRAIAKSSSTIKLAWSPSNNSDNQFRLYRNGNLIAELEGNVSAFEVINLKPRTSYAFQISAVSAAKREGPKSGMLSVSTAPVKVFRLKPAEYLAGRIAPKFREGHTLLPLTKWSWPFSFGTIVEMARWGYALDFNEANAKSISRLDDPRSVEAKLARLARENPDVYKLSVNIARIPSDEIPSTAYTGRSVLNNKKVWSPEAPDSVMADLATTVTGYLKRVLDRAPAAIILNGGERYLGVVGHARSAWAADAGIVAAKGKLRWPEYISKRKAHQEMFVTNAVRALTPAPYIWYYAGGNQYRAQRKSFWYDWDWDYRWMHPVTTYPNNSLYWREFNSGWVANDDGNDLLSQTLNATGYAITFGQPLAYNWVCAGWLRPSHPNKGFGDIERYYGFLKSAYTAGMIGAVAGYFAYPAEGFNPTFASNDPPHWLEQVEALGHVHAEFSYLETFLRNGYLLPGPSMNEKNPTQPAYEFYSGYANTRVLVRKLKEANEWIISAWAADGVVRTVPINIPNLGTMKVQAYPAGSLYHAQILAGQPLITALDLGSRTPTPLQLTNTGAIERRP